MSLVAGNAVAVDFSGDGLIRTRVEHPVLNGGRGFDNGIENIYQVAQTPTSVSSSNTKYCTTSRHNH